MLKSIAKKFLTAKPVNYPLVSLLKLISNIMPVGINNYIFRLPLNRKFTVTEDGYKPFKMISRGNDSIAKEIFWQGLHSYESRTLSIITALMNQSNIFIDIGANTGLFTLLAASNPQITEIHSFEPMPEAYSILIQNINLNKFNNIIANKTALSNFDGESIFNITEDDGNIALGSSLREDVSKNKVSKKLTVQTVKLDTYYNLYNFSGNILIKIDTEGTEDTVLEGSINFIDKLRPVMLCEVLSHTGTEPGIHRILDSRNYNYYYINDTELEKVEIIKGDPYIVSNYLLLPEEKAEKSVKGYKITNSKEKIF